MGFLLEAVILVHHRKIDEIPKSTKYLRYLSNQVFKSLSLTLLIDTPYLQLLLCPYICLACDNSGNYSNKVGGE